MRRMYGMFPYIWRKFMVNMGKYSLHGAFGYGFLLPFSYVDRFGNSYNQEPVFH